MAWLPGVITGTATLLGVLIGSRLTVRTERKQWLRDNRLRLCVNLIEQVESFISDKDTRRTDMDKSVGTLVILGPSQLAGAAGTLVSRADDYKATLFGDGNEDANYKAFRLAEWGFRGAASRAIGVKEGDTLTMAEVDAAAAELAARQRPAE